MQIPFMLVQKNVLLKVCFATIGVCVFRALTSVDALFISEICNIMSNQSSIVQITRMDFGEMSELSV